MDSPKRPPFGEEPDISKNFLKFSDDKIDRHRRVVIDSLAYCSAAEENAIFMKQLQPSVNESNQKIKSLKIEQHVLLNLVKELQKHSNFKQIYPALEAAVNIEVDRLVQEEETKIGLCQKIKNELIERNNSLREKWEYNEEYLFRWIEADKKQKSVESSIELNSVNGQEKPNVSRKRKIRPEIEILRTLSIEEIDLPLYDREFRL